MLQPRFRPGVLVLCCLLTLAIVRPIFAQQSLSLHGQWQLALGDSPAYTDRILLPNSLLTAGKGDLVTLQTQWTGSLYDSSYYHNPFMRPYQQAGKMKFPFFLTPERHYVGRAWYRRSVSVPADWKGQHITLTLERPHIETTVLVNGHEVGRGNSLSVPHEFDLTQYLKPGEENDLQICVYNGIDGVGVGQDSHSVTDQTQGNWNGLVGDIRLTARPMRHIRRVRVTPNIAERSIAVQVALSQPGRIAYEVAGRRGSTRDTAFVIPLGDACQLWDEFNPVTYTLTLSLGRDTVRTQFGLREIRAEGPQLFLNDRPLFLRGTVENCTFPDTGYPPTDVASWLRIFRKCKEYGLNHVRFHSYCPPEAAFVAADQVGIYLQPEGPSWPNHGVKLGQGQIIDQYLMQETQRMVEAYGNHPSFCFMAAGNEPAGPWVAWCKEWCRYWRTTDSRRLYAGASVGGGWQWDEGSDYHVKGGARGLVWSRTAPQTADDYTADITVPRNFQPTAERPTNTEPYVSHEKGQWCAFPDLDETKQYTGVYRAHNFDIFSDLLARNGMASQATKFLWASGRLQQLCYRMEMERHLRTPDYAGFQLLGLNDYSGQGTALVGVLNTQWQEKGYTDAAEWTQSCAPLVVLAHFPKFVFTPDETLELPLSAYNATASALPSQVLRWNIDGQEGGELRTPAIPLGKGNRLGTLRLAFDALTAPAKHTLILCLGTQPAKHYEFWVYPAFSAPATSTTVAEFTELTDEALAVLRRGGTVLLTAAGKITLGSDIRQDYLPVFWNTSWFKMKPPHTTGCTIEAGHPLFRHFPTDDWGNLNWWELLNRAQVMNLEALPMSYQPPIQPIDTWHVSRKLGMLIEAQVAGGRLLMTTMDITNRLDNRPVAAQMRRAILAYMESDDFRPTLRLTPDDIRDFYWRKARPVDMFTNESPDELKPNFANQP